MRWLGRAAWAPSDPGWRVNALFIVGSVLFAIGAFPPYSHFVDGRAVGITFVIGSLCFTAAGYGTAVKTFNEGRDNDLPTLRWTWSPRTTLWWAAVIQLLGTLLFNVSTIDAMVTTFTVEETNRLVWAPDVFGCIAFLVASHLFWLNTNGPGWRRDIDDADWWSVLLDYVGSLCFMASAIAAFTLRTTDEMLDVAIVNTATFIGALCFLVGSYVLLPSAPEHGTPR